MKYSKNAKYDYEINGINEENGYTKWYNKEITGKVPIGIIFRSFGKWAEYKKENYGKQYPPHTEKSPWIYLNNALTKLGCPKQAVCISLL